MFGNKSKRSAPEIWDNCIDNFVVLGDDLFIVSDVPHMLKIQMETLDTLAQIDMEEYVEIKSMTSHPLVDKNGTVWNVGTAYDGKKGAYSYVVLKMERTNARWSSVMVLENSQVVASIPARHKRAPAFMHSFAATENYVVVVEQPLYGHGGADGHGPAAGERGRKAD